MKALVVTAPGKVKIVNDVPMPQPNEYEALLRVRACGFCNGTDFQIINGTLPENEGLAPYPTLLGHEGAGEVVAVGSKVRYIKEGDRFIKPAMRYEVGNGYTKTHGAFAQYGLIPDVRALEEDGIAREDIPAYLGYGPHCFGYNMGPDANGRATRDTDFVDGGVFLTLCECLSTAMNYGIGDGDSVLVFGSGPMGLGMMRFAKILGAARVVAVDALEDRLELARRIGKADETINFKTQDVAKALNGELFDYVVDAVGSSKILIDGSFHCKPNGTLGAYGVLKDDDTSIDINLLKNTVKLHKHTFPYRQLNALNPLLDMIAKGQLDPKEFYSHVLPLEEIEQAMELIRSKQSLKVILTID